MWQGANSTAAASSGPWAASTPVSKNSNEGSTDSQTDLRTESSFQKIAQNTRYSSTSAPPATSQTVFPAANQNPRQTTGGQIIMSRKLPKRPTCSSTSTARL